MRQGLQVQMRRTGPHNAPRPQAPRQPEKLPPSAHLPVQPRGLPRQPTQAAPHAKEGDLQKHDPLLPAGNSQFPGLLLFLNTFQVSMIFCEGKF